MLLIDVVWRRHRLAPLPSLAGLVVQVKLTGRRAGRRVRGLVLRRLVCLLVRRLTEGGGRGGWSERGTDTEEAPQYPPHSVQCRTFTCILDDASLIV